MEALPSLSSPLPPAGLQKNEGQTLNLLPQPTQAHTRKTANGECRESPPHPALYPLEQPAACLPCMALYCIGVMCSKPGGGTSQYLRTFFFFSCRGERLREGGGESGAGQPQSDQQQACESPPRSPSLVCLPGVPPTPHYISFTLSKGERIQARARPRPEEGYWFPDRWTLPQC